MAVTHAIPEVKDATQLGKDLADGDAILVTSIIPEEYEDELIKDGLVTRLSCNRIVYPSVLEAAGWKLTFIGEMKPWSYRYMRVSKEVRHCERG